MKQVVIENPVLNAPYNEPNRHFKFTDEGISNEIVEKRPAELQGAIHSLYINYEKAYRHMKNTIREFLQNFRQ